MSVDLTPGTVIGGDFRIVRALGEGGMGAVYIAEQESTGKQRALKVMRRELVTDARSRQRFIEEAKVGARIESAHVVEVIAAGVDDATGVPYLAMELLDGNDLEAHLRVSGPVPFAELVSLYEQLAHALGEAHRQGVIHRDLKPENLFLARSRRVGSKPVLKVLDFGIATFVKSDKTAATVTSAIGSPLWVAPEQMSTGSKLRPSTDVWAMGLIAFYLLTGRSYWPAANAEPFNLHALMAEILAHPLVPASQRAAELGVPGLPPGFDAWFARCVIRDPLGRFADAAEAHAGLANLGGASSAHGTPATLAATTPLPGAGFGSPTPATAPLHVDAPSIPGWQAAAPTGQPVGPGGRGPLLVGLGLGLLALLAIGGGSAFFLLPAPTEENGVGPISAEPETTTDDFEREVALCERELAAQNGAAALRAARAALVSRPNDRAASACRQRAEALQRDEHAFARGVSALEQGDLETAHREFDSLPAESALRGRPQVAQATRSLANTRLAAARAALPEDPAEAERVAGTVLAMRDLLPAQRAEATAIQTQAQAAPAAADDQADRRAEERRRAREERERQERERQQAESQQAIGDPERSGGRSEAARRCSMQGDQACVIRMLEGNARSPQDLGMLIEAYRARGQRPQAHRHMRTFVARFPTSSRAGQYRQILAQEGGGGSSGSTGRRGGSNTAPANPF